MIRIGCWRSGRRLWRDLDGVCTSMMREQIALFQDYCFEWIGSPLEASYQRSFATCAGGWSMSIFGVFFLKSFVSKSRFRPQQVICL